MQQGFLLPARQPRRHQHVLSKIVGVRINLQQLDADGKRELIAHHKVFLPRRNIQLLIAFELQQHGKLRGRLRREIQPDAGLDRFRFADGLQMRVQYQIISGIKPQRHSGGFRGDQRTGLPEKKMAVGIELFGFDLQFHAGESVAGSGFLAARGIGAVHE